MLSTINQRDPGDETLHRYRYQHAYGTMLALGALRGDGAVIFDAIYCEHHEDLLGERTDGRVYAYQVKTQKKELGYWTNSDEAFVGSIKRFVALERSYGTVIEQFAFVSNTELKAIDPAGNASEKTKSTSPAFLLNACAACETSAQLPPAAATAFASMRETCNCDAEILMTVLKKMVFILGPDLSNYEAALIADVLPRHKDCVSLPPSTLRRLARELIEIFTSASGLPVDPDAYVIPSDRAKNGTTTASAKRISVATIADILARVRQPPPYAQLEGDLSLKTLGDGHQTLAKKLRAGGLETQVPNMQRRLLTTFEWLMERQYIDAQAASQELHQLEGVVEGIYADQHALLEELEQPFGRRLYNGMGEEFRRLVQQEPHKVCYQDHERLFGITGLLTERCTIWWSARFDIEAAS